MSKIRIITIVFAVGLFGALGCSENKAVKAAKKAADEVCKCEDAKCARTKFAEGSAKIAEIVRTAKGTEDDAKKIIAAQRRAKDCLSKRIASK